MAGKILNYGSLNIDYVYVLDHIVKAGETIASSDYQIFAGGKGLNQSVAMARAGAKVCHAGKIGKEGVFLKEALEKEGIDCKNLLIGDCANGHAIIQRAADGENSIILYAGANHEITKEEIASVLSQFGEGDILVCQNEISNLPYLIKEAFQHGMKIAWNPSPVTEVVHEVDFSMISWLIINEIEGQYITGAESAEEILQWFKTFYPKLKLVLTLGKQGSIYQDAETLYRQPIFPAKTKDTTAAGDTFLGYFVSATEALGEAASEEAMKLAAAASALAVETEGAMPSIPKMDSVKEKIDSKM